MQAYLLVSGMILRSVSVHIDQPRSHPKLLARDIACFAIFVRSFLVSFTLILYFDVLILPGHISVSSFLHTCMQIKKNTLLTLFADFESINWENKSQVLLHCKTWQKLLLPNHTFLGDVCALSLSCSCWIKQDVWASTCGFFYCIYKRERNDCFNDFSFFGGG